MRDYIPGRAYLTDLPVGKMRVRATSEVIRDYPTADREGCSDLADSLELTAAAHYSLEPNADRHRRYGRCVQCGEWWPCPTFNSARSIAVEWLASASNAIMRRQGLIGPALAVGDSPPQPDVEMLECYWCDGDCLHENAPGMERLLALSDAIKLDSVVSNGHHVEVTDAFGRWDTPL